MKVYTKPDFTVYSFDVREYVASCENPETYSAVSVDCLIKSGDVDGVFYNDGKNICSYYATSSNLITLNGWTYLYWYGSPSGNPEAGGTNSDGTMYGQVLMNALEGAGVSGGSGNSVLHAGLASAKVTQLINTSL
ncbi:MAG: hypothetical protein LUH07_15565 [Lachnospiraceae bacterium]|nr:hypothetical protein [Lachnospiraceae bacterium]